MLKKFEFAGIAIAIAAIIFTAGYFVGKGNSFPDININVAEETAGSSGSIDDSEWKININTASAEELMELPGIGESISKNIIEYRTENGPFQRIEDIANVKGIGDAKYMEIKDLITV